MDDLVDTWAALAARTCYISGGHAQARTVLAAALRQLAAALTTVPFDATPGYRIGFDLVSARINSPQALGGTVTLLGQQLIAKLGIEHPKASAQLTALLGQLVTGFTEALRRVAVAGAEDIARAERSAWREQQVMLNRKLQQAQLCERLTGLPNRVWLVNRLTELLTDAPGAGRLGVCLINLDRFQAVNDSLGRDKGDQLIGSVALRLRRLADRHGYVLAHLGADEFAFVVEGTAGIDDLAKMADQALLALSEPFGLGGHNLSVSASAGVVERAAAGADPVELLRAADITLRWAKTNCRGQWTAFDPDRYEGELRRHKLTAAMPAALDRGEFALVYQPLIRLADGRVFGAEALARWHHPDHGTISPARFIPLAEHTGLIGPLGLYLLEQACRQAATWHRRGHTEFVISVNLAVAQLHTPGLATTVAAILDRSGLPADRLQLEITESALAGTEDGSLENLHALAGHGIRLAIDDFGTGYSCLAYLAKLPVHALKLAPGFLDGLGDTTTRHSNNTILPALVKLSHDLGLTVTAEGIETAAQAKALTALGCDLGQGFYLGHPTANGNITRLLNKTTPPRRDATRA
jgi:diguanylate cyclase (GGDEF)-like protein